VLRYPWPEPVLPVLRCPWPEPVLLQVPPQAQVPPPSCCTQPKKGLRKEKEQQTKPKASS
jgi:hypothetical protein